MDEITYTIAGVVGIGLGTIGAIYYITHSFDSIPVRIAKDYIKHDNISFLKREKKRFEAISKEVVSSKKYWEKGAEMLGKRIKELEVVVN